MRLALPFAVVAVLALHASASPARAQESTAGQVTFAALVAAATTKSTVSPHHATIDFGGVVMADLWANAGLFRVGAALGVAPMTSEDAAHARVLLPLGLSGAVSLHDEGSHLTVEPRLRAGVWAGATNFGLAADVWGSLGVWLGYDLGNKVVAYVGMDAWIIHAQDSQEEMAPMKRGFGTFVFFSPGLSLSWTP